MLDSGLESQILDSSRYRSLYIAKVYEIKQKSAQEGEEEDLVLFETFDLPTQQGEDQPLNLIVDDIGLT